MAKKLADIMAELHQRGIPSPAAKLDGSAEKKVNCSKCEDQLMVHYRVHRDADWTVNPDTGKLVPDPKFMVLESDFLAMRVCGPEEARNWQRKYSIQCECVKKIRINRLMKSSEITDEFKLLGFQNFKTKGKAVIVADMKECAMDYYKEFEKIRSKRANSMALLGQPGSGKTHLMMAISNNLIVKKGVSVHYFPYVEGFNDLKEDFEQIAPKLERMKNADVLFIDDLFKPVGRGVNRKPRATEWQIEQMYAVINYRYLNHLPILVSSELDVDQMDEVDEALGSRIYEMCQDFTVVIEGDRKILNYRLVGLNDV
ncbi:ATP-binding protein [Domibacillus epiphyticus]|uniref:ATP-binding protein n=2 Tax=Domibacillus epiphyticus TaxID=1714355 RepID=A0A1V2A7R7_9BACI|nr:ATP-binding protein [Domibacillus epiphyticus]